MTELHDIPRTGNKAEAPTITEADTEPYLKRPIIMDEPEVVVAREGIHERIQAEIQHKGKEA